MSPQEITIVSGLPRSGTSLMMQMLAAGGMEPVTDEIREADPDNPKGYLEFERVKKIRDDKAWLPDARGKVVKMISQLLYELPDTESFNVIFMRRDIDEIIASQEKMLIRRGVTVPDPDAIKGAFQVHLEKLFQWLPSRNYIRILEVNYNDLLASPYPNSRRIADFIPLPLDIARMSASVDTSLYRNRVRPQAQN